MEWVGCGDKDKKGHQAGEQRPPDSGNRAGRGQEIGVGAEEGKSILAKHPLSLGSRGYRIPPMLQAPAERQGHSVEQNRQEYLSPGSL